MTGRAVADTLHGRVKGLFVTDHGEISQENREYFKKSGIVFEEGEHTKKALESDLMVVSPGVPPGSDLVQEANSLGITVLGEIELADRLSPSEKTVAITGTNGKTTTVKLTEALLNHAGKRAVACGNIGNPYIKAVSSLNPSDVPVVEVSSYQLQYTERFHPSTAVLLNIASDHLERHGSFENYREAKLRIFSNQGKDDHAVINSNLNLERLPGEAEVVRFRRKNIEGVELAPHQQENLGAAAAATRCTLGNGEPLTLPSGVIDKTIEVPHRLEKIKETGGRKIINDSKATNPAATAAALSALTEPIHLLLGGQAKNAEYGRLARKIKRASVEEVYIFGTAREALANYLIDAGFEAFTTFPSLKEATEAAIRNSSHGDTILLSPGCSSFDAFSSFEERGDKFSRLVEELT